jgi:CrcB protein
MFPTLLQVALGGAIGASARYGVGVAVVRLTGHHGFPLGVLTVNILGSFLMGAFITAAAERGLTHWAPFVATGILGGFTTFSSFSLEAMTLWERGEAGQAMLYILLSVLCSLVGLALGLWIARAAFA